MDREIPLPHMHQQNVFLFIYGQRNVSKSIIPPLLYLHLIQSIKEYLTGLLCFYIVHACVEERDDVFF